MHAHVKPSLGLFSGLKILGVLLVGSLLLSACGFQLRGLAQLSFHNIFIQGSTLSMSKELKKSLETNGVKVVTDSEDAELMLELLSEETDKRILSIGGDGKVSEYATHGAEDSPRILGLGGISFEVFRLGECLLEFLRQCPGEVVAANRHVPLPNSGSVGNDQVGVINANV